MMNVILANKKFGALSWHLVNSLCHNARSEEYKVIQMSLTSS